MNGPIEVKTLLGQKNLDFSIACLTSFVTNAEAKIRLLIFDDGSLTSIDKSKLQASITDSIVIDKQICNSIVNSALSAFPASTAYRDISVYSRKIFDVILYDNKNTFYIDSDIFFLKKFRLPEVSSTPVFMYDSQNAYSFKPSEFLKINYKIYPRINSGFFYFPREKFDLTFIEKMVKDKILNKGLLRNMGWHEQTLWALIASKDGAVTYFDKSQIQMVTKTLNISSKTVCVHLVSSFRGHFDKVKAHSLINNAGKEFEKIKLCKAVLTLNAYSYYTEKIMKRLKSRFN